MSSSRIVVENFESGVLKNNPLGDPYVRRVPIYLPAGYDDTHARYPVVYLLTGFTGRGTMLLNDAGFDENIQERLDRLIAQGDVQPLIVVMPDCFTRYGGSQYVNSSATGRYEDHVMNELVPYVDAHYRTRADASHRIVMGKSSGGYGSVWLALRHPDVFGLMVSHSGDMYFEYCYLPDFPKSVGALRKHGDLKKYLDGLRALRPSERDHALLNTAAMAACYSPNPNSRYGFDLPFDEETGELRAEVWARWLEHDPVYLVDQSVTALKQLKFIFVDGGLRDEFNLQYGARIFVKKLSAHGINVVHEEFEDGHFNIAYRYDVSLKAVSQALV